MALRPETSLAVPVQRAAAGQESVKVTVPPAVVETALVSLDAGTAGVLPFGGSPGSGAAGPAAAAAVQALGWPSGAVNVCDDEPASGREWAPVYCRRHGGAEPPVSVAPRTPWARGAANRLARQERGWTPRCVSWRTGFLA